MSSLPLFYHEPGFTDSAIQLNEDTARHIVQVLRMQVDEHLQLTDGKGNVANVTITETAKKKCAVAIKDVKTHSKVQPDLYLAVAFTKNTSRNEWLLEKATELGVASIIPLSATRTEKERIRIDRWHNILVSAMLQSQQYYLPHLAEITSLNEVIATYKPEQKLLAHCISTRQRRKIADVLKPQKETLILIGPEGDFTADEVTLCEQNGFTAISLATQRLRTETAAMSVCAYFNTINNETE